MILTSGVVFLICFVLIWWLAIYAGRGIVLLGPRQEMPDDEKLRNEYIKSLSQTVRVHRWLGVSILLLIVATIAVIIWQTSHAGWERLLTLHVANEAAFLGLARFVFKRTGEYEKMLREALGFKGQERRVKQKASGGKRVPGEP